MAWRFNISYNYLISPKFIGRMIGLFIIIAIYFFLSSSIGKYEINQAQVIKFEPVIINMPNQKIEKTINEIKPENLNPKTNKMKSVLTKTNSDLQNLKLKSQKQIGDNYENKNIKSNIISKGPIENNSFEDENDKILSEKSQKTLFAIECLKFDEKERPKNCPPNNHAKKLIQFENSPKYNGENVIGFTSAEIKAKKAAGWRDKCEKNEGGKYQACMAIGKKPPRVKTPYELCIEKGLQGCTRPQLPNGAKSDPILGF